MIGEIRLLIENLDFDCTIETLQMTNVLFNVRGKLSALKDEMLAKINQSKESTPRGRGFVSSPLEGGQKPALRSRGCWSNGVLE